MIFAAGSSEKRMHHIATAGRFWELARFQIKAGLWVEAKGLGCDPAHMASGSQ